MIIFSTLTLSAVMAAGESLQLTIALEKTDTAVHDGRSYCSATIRATVTNRSGKTATFFFEDCGICFWQAAINGAGCSPVTAAVHCRPCDFRKTVTLKPGESAHKTLNVFLPGISTPKSLKSIRILLLRSMDSKNNLQSNKLKL